MSASVLSLAFMQGSFENGAVPAIAWLLYIAVIVVMIAAMWKLFTKAGQPGWAAIIPIYNVYVMLQIVGRPGWWLLLLFVPIANFVVSIIVALDLAKSYGQGVGFGIGLILLSPIFYLILGFGGSRYTGPAAAS